MRKYVNLIFQKHTDVDSFWHFVYLGFFFVSWPNPKDCQKWYKEISIEWSADY